MERGIPWRWFVRMPWEGRFRAAEFLTRINHIEVPTKAISANAYEKITHHLTGYCWVHQRLRAGLCATASGACYRLRGCGTRSALLHTRALLPLGWCALCLGTWPLVSPARTTCLGPWGLRCSLVCRLRHTRVCDADGSARRPGSGSAVGYTAKTRPK